MSERQKAALRLKQVLELIKREDQHLQGIHYRFFGEFNVTEVIDATWLEKKLSTDEGVDQLESFVGKFTRMQDTLMDKAIPLFLKYLGEPVGSAIDNVNRMEKLNFIDQANDWVEMRYLRNRLVHEHMEEARN